MDAEAVARVKVVEEGHRGDQWLSNVLEMGALDALLIYQLRRDCSLRALVKAYCHAMNTPDWMFETNAVYNVRDAHRLVMGTDDPFYDFQRQLGVPVSEWSGHQNCGALMVRWASAYLGVDIDEAWYP